MSFFTRDREIPPEHVNEHGQVTDERILKKDRAKFGLASILFQSEETGLGGLPSVIIRALGGDDRHIGLYGSTQGVTSISQFLGAVILRRTKSDAKGMIFSMYIGVFVAAVIAVTIFCAAVPSIRPIAVYLYLGLAIFFAAVGGFQWNIESSWIGDLVPKNKLGWFTSYKWIVGTAGVMVFNIVIAKIVDRYASTTGYAAVYLMFSVSFLLAALIYATATDRTPKNLFFLSSGESHHERINYRSLPLWCYITFYMCWSGGRTMMFSFTWVYLIDQFQFTMTKMAWLSVVAYASSLVVLWILGRFTDRIGHRVPLLVISGCIALSMTLWITSAWLGVLPIIVYQILNGAAGNTHSMLAINTALEIFPDKGRAAYLGFSRFCLGCVTMTAPVAAGLFMRALADFQVQVHGVTFSRYHLLFAICTVISLCCTIPLLILGNRKVD